MSDMPQANSASPRRLNIFLSHKQEDSQYAWKIKNILEEHGNGRLHVFISEELRYGADWEAQVLEMLRQSHWLVFLYNNPAAEWNWCFFEIGYFENEKQRNPAAQKELVVIHAGRVPVPDPLRRYRSVASTAHRPRPSHTVSHDEADGQDPDVEDLVRWIYAYGDPDPINPDLARRKPTDPAKFREIVNVISEPFMADPLDRIYALTVDLRVPEDAIDGADRGCVPDATRVFGRDGSLRTLFGLQQRPEGISWGEFIVHLRSGRVGPKRFRTDHAAVWTEPIGEAMRTDREDAIPPTTLPLLLADDERVYRPELNRVSRGQGRERVFEVRFTYIPPDATTLVPPHAGHTEKWIRALTSSLVICRMFRWGVLNPFQREIERLPQTQGKPVAEVLDALSVRFHNVICEGLAQGLNEWQVCMEAFADCDDRARRMTALGSEWFSRERELSDAIEKRDVEGVLAVMHALRDLNREYMCSVSERVTELIQRATTEEDGV
ncbi:MAG: toll/interleukin-1 receptor domain-containing protein [Phycisphaerales bacterium]|nr:MAG: toll/interleukin-1 receptor domain-containing protein [Phycisphaerales bacterium]